MVTNETVDELDERVVAKGLHANNVEKASEIIVHLCCYWQQFSFTKYCETFTEVKECFGIVRCNN